MLGQTLHAWMIYESKSLEFLKLAKLSKKSTVKSENGPKAVRSTGINESHCRILSENKETCENKLRIKW